ncbi:tetrahydrofolate dehydrogenase/cyclohydrolase catalytic domain-containing protein [Mycolicibacterium smegmatis]|uniref:tetrahydrofolate dehydrogenase/cyclohydrolase catalytic domain-containing protein n=1 Tax=Mycolicibacterium smegmatis TaxID=1772 RepID=UPI00307FBFA0
MLLPHEEEPRARREIIDGTRVAQAILDQTREEAANFHTISGRKPCLATVLVGDDPASHTYVRMKANTVAAPASNPAATTSRPREPPVASSTAVPSWANPSVCCSSPATPPSPTATHEPQTCPRR